MDTRNDDLLAVRPPIPKAKLLPDMSLAENFQNKVLRPIIKLQNALLLAVFQHYIHKNKNRFYQLTLEQRLGYISHALQKDMRLRSTYKGVILGFFTIAEYEEYLGQEAALNKRMINIIIKRLQDQLQFFEDTSSRVD